jgi:hypothetical protein
LSDDTVHQVNIERKGGLAGFGLPNSRIRSRGSVDLRTLSLGDRQAIESLFVGRTPIAKPASPVQADAFHYHLTMTTPDGEKTVIVPEHQVPEAIRDAVQDELE